MRITRLVLVPVMLGIAACATQAGLPALETASFRLLDASDLTVSLANEGDASVRPGALAGETAADAAADCIGQAGIIGILISPLCAAAGAVTGAATGAVVTTAQTLPADDAESLFRASRTVMEASDWDARVAQAVRQSAPAHDVVLDSGAADSRVSFRVSNLRWRIFVGNQAAIECRAWIVVEHAGERFTRSYEHRTEARQVDDWIADDGQAIAAALEQLFVEVGDSVWSDLDG